MKFQCNEVGLLLVHSGVLVSVHIWLLRNNAECIVFSYMVDKRPISDGSLNSTAPF